MITSTVTKKRTKWIVDPKHSKIQFKVKKLILTTVTGKFHEFEGKIDCENDDFDGARIFFSIEVDSLDTNIPKRDAHLKSEDFFASKKYPKIYYIGDLEKEGEEYVLTGFLTLGGITKEIDLSVDYKGEEMNSNAVKTANFHIAGKLNRKNFGISWDAITEAGIAIVGDDVRIMIDLQLVQS